MFGTPSRANNKSGEVVYLLDVNTTPLGVELEYSRDGLVYNKDYQPRFRTLQSLILSELAKEKHLFRNPPSLTSLEAITPNWGFVISGGNATFSQYSDIVTEIKKEQLPCLVDIQLKRLEISRSTIRPTWKLHYLGPKNPEIEFDWVAAQHLLVANDEITEVSDVPAVGSDTPRLTLSDPAARIREKMEAKSKIHAAFTEARNARLAAEQLAKNFYDSYDLSDSESAFTEWLSDSDESDSE